MATSQSPGSYLPGIGIEANTIVGITAGLVNAAFSAGLCVAFFGWEVLLTDIGCWHFITYTSFIIAGIGTLFPRYADRLPGDGSLSKFVWVGAATYILFASGTLLPTVPPITASPGVGINLLYFAGTAALVVTTTVLVHSLLTGNEANAA